MIDFVVGVGIVSALLLYFAFSLDIKKKETPALRMLMILFSLGFLLLIPSHLISEKMTCSVVVDNTTITGNLTTYDYTRVCFNPLGNTRTVFYTSYGMFLAIFFMALLFLASFWLINGPIKELLNRYGK